MYYIGIDGQTTETTFTIINKNGIKIDEIITNTIDHKQISLEKVENILKNNIDLLLSRNNIIVDEVRGVFLGIPGYIKIKGEKQEIDRIVEKILGNIKFKIGNEIQSKLCGAFLGQAGIYLDCGIETIALGKSTNGKTIKYGGWGDYIGNEGSAYWIGKKTLEVFAKQADKRLHRDDLYYHIKEVLNIQEDLDIIDYVVNKINKDKSKIAEFSSICFESALNGDKSAIKIFEECAYELSLLIKMIIKELKLKSEILVSYSGGVFKSKSMILDPLKENLKEYNIKLIEPLLSSKKGACLLAYKIENEEVDNIFIENLTKNLESINI